LLLSAAAEVPSVLPCCWLPARFNSIMASHRRSWWLQCGHAASDSAAPPFVEGHRASSRLEKSTHRECGSRLKRRSRKCALSRGFADHSWVGKPDGAPMKTAVVGFKPNDSVCSVGAVTIHVHLHEIPTVPEPLIQNHHAEGRRFERRIPPPITDSASRFE
jgi:hypothetical protein